MDGRASRAGFVRVPKDSEACAGGLASACTKPEIFLEGHAPPTSPLTSASARHTI